MRQIAVHEAIIQIEKDISELENKKQLLENLDLSVPITEEIWHEICETPLRTSEYMKDVLLTIFPDAENIQVDCNFVSFVLKGFHLQIPTSRCRGINVDTSWYYVVEMPEEIDWNRNTPVCKMKRYFDAVKENADWYTKARLRIRHSWMYNKATLFVKWYAWYRWRDCEIQIFKRLIQEEIQDYENLTKHRQIERQEIRNKAKKMVNELLPEIEKFSKTHYAFERKDVANKIYSIEEIKKVENL